MRAGRNVRQGGLRGPMLFVAAATPARQWGRLQSFGRDESTSVWDSGSGSASASDTDRGRRWGLSHARSARSAAAPRERVEIQRGAITDRRRAGRVLGGRCSGGSRARHPHQKHPQPPRALRARGFREAELCAKQRKASRSWARASAAPGSDGHPPSAAWPYSGPPAPRTRSRCRSLGCRTPRVARSCTHRLRWQP